MMFLGDCGFMLEALSHIWEGLGQPAMKRSALSL